jgi:aminopeptidase N
MEHQSAVTYGNGFANGYRGTDLSGTGEGLKFDFIIIHEAGHEWFANSITNVDVADMWIHEGFTAYSENLYLDYFFGKESSSRYVRGTRRRIQNAGPIRNSNRGVDARGTGDMYYKGANLLNTLRYAIGNDETWRQTLRNLNSHFRHQTVSSDELVAFIAEELKDIRINVPAYFAQYTQTTIVPTLEYRFTKTGLSYRWQNVVTGFNMPVLVQIAGQEPRYLFVSEKWEEVKVDYETPTLEVSPDFYVGSLDATVE